jgi:uncharacterized protein (TIGR00251 family)
MSPFLRQVPEGVVVSVHVQPRASRNEIVGLQGDALKVRLTSPPVEGAANRLCIEFFADLLDLPRSDVLLVAGDKSRQKRLLVRGMNLDQVRRIVEKKSR